MIIDRFENDFAVVETDSGEHVNIERKLLPPDAREGDCIAEENGRFIVDIKETDRRRKRIIELQNNLWE